MQLVLFLFALEAVSADNPFITRKGPVLYKNGEVFRASGANMYWLGLDENENGTPQYPTQFRIVDAFQTAVEMGATVIRAHTLGISTGNSLSYEPSLNKFNEAALNIVDFAYKTAHDYGIYLIVPFTDNYHYDAGGKHDFTDWRGISDEDQFFYNSQVISDFKNYISHYLNHTNTLTGVRYGDDPIVLAWETGNELAQGGQSSPPPPAWTSEISAYVKSLDQKHLVIDGTLILDPNALTINTIDIATHHYYPMNTGQLTSDANLVYEYGRAFFVGEYGWDASNLPQFLQTIENLTSISMDTYWSFFPHRDDHGFEQHNDGFTLHYPGDTSDMKSWVQDLRTHAFKMSGISPPPASIIPPAPVITYLASGGIAWRGAAGAVTYDIVGIQDPSVGSWTVFCDHCVTDNQSPWYSSSIKSGWWYSVKGYNQDGKVGASAVGLQCP